MPPVAIECVRYIRREAPAVDQKRHGYVKCLDSGLADEPQEFPDESNELIEDNLACEIPGLDVALREIGELLHQYRQDPGPHRDSDDPSDSA
jgi:hypothetical protein